MGNPLDQAPIEKPALRPIKPISSDAGTVVPMMLRWMRKMGAVASHLSSGPSSMYAASGVAAMPMPCTDMNRACASASASPSRGIAASCS